jgi:hypothetical protein
VNNAPGILLTAPSWTLVRNVAIGVAIVLWLASASWVLRDARRRIGNPLLAGVATLLGLVLPFLGPIVYLFFRPAELLREARERELELRAIEQRLALRGIECPTCRAAVESTYLVCPICTTRLRQACQACNAPLEAIWLACPYCATPVPPIASLPGGRAQLRAPQQRLGN